MDENSHFISVIYDSSFYNFYCSKAFTELNSLNSSIISGVLKNLSFYSIKFTLSLHLHTFLNTSILIKVIKLLVIQNEIKIISLNVSYQYFNKIFISNRNSMVFFFVQNKMFYRQNFHNDGFYAFAVPM